MTLAVRELAKRDSVHTAPAVGKLSAVTVGVTCYVADCAGDSLQHTVCIPAVNGKK